MKLPIKVFEGSPIKAVKELKGKDTILYMDGDSDYCWIVLISKGVVIENHRHYMMGETFVLYTLSDFIN